MSRIFVRYATFVSSADGTFQEQLSAYLDTVRRPAVIAVQHISFLYTDSAAAMANDPTGAQYLLTFGD